MIELDHWVGGRRVPGTSGRFGEVTDPARGVVTKRVPFASTAEVDEVVATARKAADAWRTTSLGTRATAMFRLRSLLEDRRDDLAALITASTARSCPTRRARWPGGSRTSSSPAACPTC
jgi:malonate-semialdehyde dehydrogenase (acetylating)/methylmalonate-semialdehyde dehydrogenase